MHVILIKWWIIKILIYSKQFLFVQHHWKSINEIYIASPLWIKLKLTGILTVLRCIFGSNPNFNLWGLVAWTSSKWGKFWLLSSIWPWKSRSINPKTIRISTKVFCTSDPTLVILAWKGGELWHAKARGWHTQTRGQTDAGNDNNQLGIETHRHRQTDVGNDNKHRQKLASGENDIPDSVTLFLEIICLLTAPSPLVFSTTQ